MGVETAGVGTPRVNASR